MSDEWVEEISKKYIELFEKLIGEKFIKGDTEDVNKRVEISIVESLKRIHSDQVN